MVRTADGIPYEKHIKKLFVQNILNMTNYIKKVKDNE
jgi:hypothetical protein